MVVNPKFEIVDHPPVGGWQTPALDFAKRIALPRYRRLCIVC
jgi:hypothetical protein